VNFVDIFPTMAALMTLAVSSLVGVQGMKPTFEYYFAGE